MMGYATQPFIPLRTLDLHRKNLTGVASANVKRVFLKNRFIDKLPKIYNFIFTSPRSTTPIQANAPKNIYHHHQLRARGIINAGTLHKEQLIPIPIDRTVSRLVGFLIQEGCHTNEAWILVKKTSVNNTPPANHYRFPEFPPTPLSISVFYDALLPIFNIFCGRFGLSDCPFITRQEPCPLGRHWHSPEIRDFHLQTRLLGDRAFRTRLIGAGRRLTTVYIRCQPCSATHQHHDHLFH